MQGCEFCFETMARRVQELLFAFDRSKQAFDEGQIADPFKPIIKSIEDVVKRLLRDKQVSFDEKLACTLYLFSSKNPPDLLQFLLWSATSKDLDSSKLNVLKFFYDYIKIFGNTPLFSQLEKPVFDVIWRVYQRAQTPSLRGICLQCLGLMVKRFFRILFETDQGEGRVTGDEESSLFGKMMQSLQTDFQSSKGSVRGNTLKVLGTLIERSCVEGSQDLMFLRKRADSILMLCRDELKKAFSAKNSLERGLISGAFSCLSKVLHHFQGIYSNPGDVQKLFGFLSIVALNAEQETRYEMPGKAFRFLEEHAGLFQEEIGKNPQQLFRQLLHVVSFAEERRIAKLRKHALPALESVMNQIAELCFHKRDENYEYFTQYFYDQLHQPSDTQLAALVTLRGIIAFAGPLVEKIGSCFDLLTVLAGYSDRHNVDMLNEPMKNEGRWAAMVLSASASVLGFIPQGAGIPTSILDRLRDLILKAMATYVYNQKAERVRILRAFNDIFLAVAVRYESLNILLEQVIPQAVTRAITRSEIFDIDKGISQAIEYAQLWKGVVDASDSGFLRVLSRNGGEAKRLYETVVSPVVFDHILAGCGDIIGRLVLTYEYQQSPSPSAVEAGADDGDADTELVVVPHQAMDQELFLSLIPFMTEFISGAKAALIGKWSWMMCRLLVKKSMEVPRVSGFYRILGTIFETLNKENLFSPGESLIPPNEMTNLLRLLSAYTSFVTAQLDQFQDELLAASLSMLLRTPAAILDFNVLLPAIRLALRTGISSHETAVDSIKALNSWTQDDGIRPRFYSILPQVLPLLDRFLYDSKLQDGEITSRDFQRDVLRFLGRIGGRSQYMIGDAGGKALSNSLSWDPLVRIPLEIPLTPAASGSEAGDPVEIDVSALLPRLLAIAESKGEEQVKVLASECIHAVIVYMVGLGAKEGIGDGRHSYGQIYRKTFPVLLKLGQDLNVITRQLFRKLIKQLIHWYSQARREHPETTALLDALSDGLSSAESGPIREFCASCFGEFVLYAVKQATKVEMASSPVGIVALLRRLTALAKHPDRFRRLGAGLALQHVIRHIRNESSLVKKFMLELFHTALVSLKLAHRDPPHFATINVAERVIDTAIKAITFYSTRQYDPFVQFFESVEERVGPSSLRDALEWLWEHAAAPEVQFRRKCLEALTILSSLLPEFHEKKEKGYLCTRAWLLKKSLRDVVHTFEGRTVGPLTKLREDYQRGPAPYAVRMEVLEVMTAALDAYSWGFQKGVLKAREFFEEKEDFEGSDVKKGATQKKKRASLSGSMTKHDEGGRSYPLFASVCDILNRFFGSDSLEDYEEELKILPLEVALLKKANGMFMKKVFDLYNTLLECDKEYFAHLLNELGLWDKKVQEIIILCLFRPWRRGWLNRPEQDENIELLLVPSVARVLDHWEVLEKFVTGQVGVEGTSLIKTISTFIKNGDFSLWHVADGLESCDVTEKNFMIRGKKIRPRRCNSIVGRPIALDIAENFNFNI